MSGVRDVPQRWSVWPRPLVVVLALAFVLYLSLSPEAGEAQPKHKGPPLSSIALFSRFAQEQGIAAPSFAAEAQPLAEASALRAPAVVTTVAGRRDVKVNQDFSKRPQNETTIIVGTLGTRDPGFDNVVIAGANDYRLGRPIGAAFYTSTDGAALIWNDGLPPYPLFAVATGKTLQVVEPPFGTGDPVLAFGPARAGEPRLVYYAYLGVSANFCEHGIFVSRSTNGLLWAEPVVPPLLPPDGRFTPVYWNSARNCNVFNDKPWLAVDTSGGPHDGRVYVTWTRFVFNHNRYQESPILMAYSDDNGETWSDSIEVSGFSRILCHSQVSGRAGRCDEGQFSNVVVGPDGTVYVAFLNQQFGGADDGFRNQYLLTKVDPDTLEVSAPSRVAGLIDGQNDLPIQSLGLTTLCNANFRLNSAGNLAIDPSGNALYLVFMDNRNGSTFPFPTRVGKTEPFVCPEGKTTDTDVFIVKSSDGGVSWSSPLRVNQDPPGNGSDQWFPFVAVAPEGDHAGRVDVVFYDRRDHPRLTRVYLARSSDGGATWDDRLVSDAFSNMNWAFGGGIFIGDYNGLAIDRDGNSYPFWTDARNGTPFIRQSDVFLEVVPP